MPKLTDTQLVILSTAARRDDGASLPLPKSLKLQGEAFNRVLNSLLKKGLLDEQPAGRDDAVWRESKDGRRQTLVITDAGRAAIGVAADEQSETQPARITPRGSKRSPVGSSKVSEPKSATASSSKAKRMASLSGLRPGTKQALLFDLLQRKEGASIAEAVVAMGWQPHSLRGAISGALKKKLGLAVISEKVEGRGRVLPDRSEALTSLRRAPGHGRQRQLRQPVSAAAAAHTRTGTRRSQQTGRTQIRETRGSADARGPRRDVGNGRW